MVNRPVATIDQHIQCTRCDTRNSVGSLYCVNCGASLSGAAEPMPRPELARVYGPRCGACGGANPHEALYCVSCGAVLAGETAGYPPRAPAPAGSVPAATIVQHIYVSAPPTLAELPIGIRALWFLFAGLWLGQIWLIVAWVLNLTVIGLPVGLWMLSLMPQVMTLRQRRQGLQLQRDRSSASFAVRAIYFVLIGWWLSLLWLQLSWVAALSVIGLPLSFLMFERVGTVTTLADT